MITVSKDTIVNQSGKRKPVSSWSTMTRDCCAC